jgi:Cu-Zn family superoxide dismutase
MSMKRIATLACALTITSGLGVGLAAAQQTKPTEPARPPHPTGSAQPTNRGDIRGANAATATLESKSGSQAKGTVSFSQSGNKVKMDVTIEGATPGAHAIHLHEKGDCSDPQANSAGGHWNPTTEDHGKWGTSPFHHGDIGNLEVGQDGKGTFTFETDMWSIGGDPKTDIIGHAVVVHATADDFKTQPTGNAGGRIACGVIQASGKGQGASKK